LSLLGIKVSIEVYLEGVNPTLSRRHFNLQLVELGLLSGGMGNELD
jgi:hypothetical protein